MGDFGGIFRSCPLTSQNLPLCGNQQTERMSGQLLRSLLQNPRNLSEVAPEVRPAVHTAPLCLKIFICNRFCVNGLWVPDALVLCPLCGIENSETSVNRRVDLALNRKIGKSDFLSLYRASKNQVCLMRESRSRDADFLSLIPGRYRHQNLKKDRIFDFLIF